MKNKDFDKQNQPNPELVFIRIVVTPGVLGRNDKEGGKEGALGACDVDSPSGANRLAVSVEGGAVGLGNAHLSVCILCFTKKYNSWFFGKKTTTKKLS